MESIDPNDQTNLNQTNELIEKSREIREKAKVAMEKLNELKSQSEQILHHDPSSEIKPQ